jgi:hypothetical protein
MVGSNPNSPNANAPPANLNAPPGNQNAPPPADLNVPANANPPASPIQAPLPNQAANPQVLPQGNRNPPNAPLPVPFRPHTDPLKLVKYLRKYNGTTNSSDFLKRLSDDIELHNIPFQWLIRNFDRIADEQALSWYNAVYPRYWEMLDQEGTDPDCRICVGKIL